MILPIVTILYGLPKEGKSSALLTWPPTIVGFDFDQGLMRGKEAQKLLKGGGLRHIKLPAPVSAAAIGGYTDKSSKPRGLTEQEWLIQKLGMRAKQTLKGYMELWDTFADAYMEALEDPEVKTLGLDTGTKAWLYCHRSHLQYVQLKAIVEGKDPREQLTQIEYGESNDSMTTILDAPRGAAKNLVIVCHTKPVWGKRINAYGRTEEYDTGEITIDGYKYTLASADVAILCHLDKDGTFWGEVTHTGVEGLPIGTRLEPVSYANIVKAVETNTRLLEMMKDVS